jgi:mono/diheme cytochrome c family protein
MKFLIGLIIGFLLIPVGAFLYFKLGMAPVSTSDGVMLFEGWASHTALHARLDREYPRTVAISVTPDNLIAGAKIYKEHCAFCHGFEGHEQNSAAKGMFPKPPHLFRGKGVTDDPAGETYWKVENGIRLSGMPGFKGALNDQQMWQVSILLANAHSLPPEAETITRGKE